MAKSFLKLDTRRPLKDGTYPVRVAVAYGTNLYLPTGLSVAADQWDAETGRALGPGAKRINNVLSTFLCRVQNTILDLRENGKFHKLTTAQLKDILLNAGKEDVTPKPITFYDVADSSKRRFFSAIIINSVFFSKILRRIVSVLASIANCWQYASDLSRKVVSHSAPV